ncbi:MAG TPA: phosphatase PAP2 family protein [Sphingomicrobium sp.]
MRRSFRWMFAAASLGCAAPVQAGTDWGTASDVGYFTLVATALGTPVVERDKDGFLQAGGSIASAWGVTEVLKRTVREERPDHSNRRSFPSGHSSQSFAAAATLQNRYGWEVGLPAHVVATFVAIARVKADKHHVHDVVAGAAIGEAAGWLITRRHDAGVQVLPWGDAYGGGATVAMRF